MKFLLRRIGERRRDWRYYGPPSSLEGVEYAGGLSSRWRGRLLDGGCGHHLRARRRWHRADEFDGLLGGGGTALARLHPQIHGDMAVLLYIEDAAQTKLIGIERNRSFGVAVADSQDRGSGAGHRER